VLPTEPVADEVAPDEVDPVAAASDELSVEPEVHAPSSPATINAPQAAHPRRTTRAAHRLSRSSMPPR